MTITVTGLGSGLDYDSWIEELVGLKQADIDEVSDEVSAKEDQKELLETLEADYNALLDSIETFTKALSSDDVFNQKAVTSTDDAITATVTNTAEVEDLKVSVSQLATATTATSSSVAASYVDGSSTVSDISEGALKTGTFSVYVGGAKSSINIENTDTMDTVLGKLNAIDGVDASLTDGKLSIAADSGYTLTAVGSNSDTSNFSNVMALTRDTSTGTYSSSKSIFDTDTSEALSSGNYAAGEITAGTFTIGDTEFTIDSSTTLDGIIKKINDSDCGATASWDSNLGKLVLTAADEGAISINVTAGDGTAGDENASNFTDIMGLTASTWNEDGTLASTKLSTDSQSLGTNAILSINGTTVTSASNTVTSDISGIQGLTLTLKDVTDSASTVSVTQDTSSVVDAITSFVSAYNTVMTATNDAIDSKNGTLNDESLLKSLRNNIRKTVTSSVTSNDIYKTLASIGITTGAIGDKSDSDTNSLTIDTDKLKAALKDNSGSVKTLLNGVFDKMTPTLNNAVATSTGYFDSTEKSYDKKIDKLNDKVEKMTEDLKDYKEMLEAKYAAMDKLISALKNQSSVFDSYFNNDSKSDS